jgi:hypothetical protein
LLYMSGYVTEGLGRAFAATALFIAVLACWLVIVISNAPGDDGVALESHSGGSSQAALAR